MTVQESNKKCSVGINPKSEENSLPFKQSRINENMFDEGDMELRGFYMTKL